MLVSFLTTLVLLPQVQPPEAELVPPHQPAVAVTKRVPQLSKDERVLATHLIERMGNASTKPEDVARARKRLHQLGPGVLPVLDAAASKKGVPAAQQRRLREVMNLFPKFRLIASVDPKVPLGTAPKLRFRLRNVWHRPLSALRALDGSDHGWRFPKYEIRITDPDGKPVKFSEPRCGNTNPLRERSFLTLQPGQEVDPFGKGSFGHYMLRWKANVTGWYKASLVLDTRGAAAQWEVPLDGKMSAAARNRLRSMTRGRFVSNVVEFEVRPSKER